jgi:hypothetical protein
LNQNDPIDHALAAIASIRDHPEPDREPEAVAVEEKPVTLQPTEAAGYSKVGPGPLAAIRLRWTVRRDDNGDYYVDETIGENSAPITVGPMSGDAAVKLVDDRESDALWRFDQFKSQMTDRGADLSREDGGEM